MAYKFSIVSQFRNGRVRHFRYSVICPSRSSFLVESTAAERIEMQRCFALLQDISSKGITLFAHATLHDYNLRVGCSMFVRYLHAGVFCERPATYFWSRRRSNEKSCTRENVFANESALSRKVPFRVQFPGRRSPRKFHQPRFDIFDLFFSLLRNREKRKNRFAAWYLNNGFFNRAARFSSHETTQNQLARYSSNLPSLRGLRTYFHSIRSTYQHRVLH